MNSDEEYCMEVLLRFEGRSCEECGKRGTEECRMICDEISKVMGN